MDDEVDDKKDVKRQELLRVLEDENPGEEPPTFGAQFTAFKATVGAVSAPKPDEDD